MKAVLCEKYGGPEVLKLREVEKPVPADNEILIKIAAAIVSPSDCAFRKGEPFIARLFAGFFRPKNSIPGEILSGEVEAVGKDVKKFKKGDLVFGSACTDLGAYAEYICLPEDGALVKNTTGLPHEQIVGLVDGPITSLPFLRDKGQIRQGQKILIIGASGSVGSAAVQLGKYYGAEVTGLCSSANFELVRSLGADKVIDYIKEDFTKNGETYDIIFDAVWKSSFSHCKKSLKPKGIYLTTFPTPGVMFKMLLSSKSSGKKAIFAATGLRKPEEKIKDLTFLAELTRNGTLKPVTDRCYRIEQIADAHRYVDEGHKKGNVVIMIEQGR